MLLRWFVSCLNLFLFSCLLWSCQEKAHVDLLLVNGKIYTMDSSRTVFEAMAVRRGQITKLGSTSELKDLFEADTIIDLHGSAMLPGMIDAHSHFMGFAKGLQEVNLVGVKSAAELLKRVKDHANSHSESWIVGRGWDQNDWQDKSYPDRLLLDSVFPDRPVCLSRVDGHAVLANSAAIRLAGMNPTLTILGGEILKLKDGSLSGVFIDRAAEVLLDKIPQPGFNQWQRWIQRAQQMCYRNGLTMVSDAGLTMSQVRLLQQAEREGILRLPLYVMLKPEPQRFDSILNAGVFSSEMLQISSFKFYVDGALGSRGALLKSPYADDPLKYGLLLTSIDTLIHYAKALSTSPFQMNAHCIGDSANSLMLKVYASVLSNGNDKRWRIEHAQVVSPEDAKLFAKYAVIPSVQPVHATSDMYWANERLGVNRIAHAYAYETLRKQNGWIASGSDFPVESINPFHGIYAAVTRKDSLKFPEKGFQMEEAMQLDDAISSYTIWAAKACRVEKKRGSLEPGKDADFIILDRDIFQIPVSDIYKIRVRSTWIKGKKVSA